MCFDKVEYYSKTARETCYQIVDKEVLTEEDEREIPRRAANHIGFFLTWLIRRGFEGELHRALPQVLEEVKTGKLLGADFVLKYCDGKFWDEDVCPEVQPFVVRYYDSGQYWIDYVDWVLSVLCNLPLGFVGSWEEYLQFEPLLDQAYQDFLDDMQG